MFHFKPKNETAHSQMLNNILIQILVLIAMNLLAWSLIEKHYNRSLKIVNYPSFINCIDDDLSTFERSTQPMSDGII